VTATLPRTELKQVCAQRSAVRLAITLVLALGPSMLLASRPSWLSLWWLVLLWPVQTFAMTGLSNGAHEAVHGHLFYRPVLDRLTGRLLHGLLLLNYDVHRRYHLTHHANTGNEEDSEGVFDFANIPTVRAYVARLVRWALPPSPLHVLNWGEGWRVVAGQPSRLGRITRRQALAGFVVPVALVGVLAYWLWADPAMAILGGVLPLFLFFPLYAYVTALPEHFGLAARDFDSRTRNIRTMPVLQYLFWNFNLHAVHHRKPGLHFSLLPGELDNVPAPTADGYVRFHIDVLRAVANPNAISPEGLGGRR
jgi:fatty acid desaturase